MSEFPNTPYQPTIIELKTSGIGKRYYENKLNGEPPLALTKTIEEARGSVLGIAFSDRILYSPYRIYHREFEQIGNFPVDPVGFIFAPGRKTTSPTGTLSVYSFTPDVTMMRNVVNFLCKAWPKYMQEVRMTVSFSNPDSETDTFPEGTIAEYIKNNKIV